MRSRSASRPVSGRGVMSLVTRAELLTASSSMCRLRPRVTSKTSAIRTSANAAASNERLRQAPDRAPPAGLRPREDPQRALASGRAGRRGLRPLLGERRPPRDQERGLGPAQGRLRVAAAGQQAQRRGRGVGRAAQRTNLSTSYEALKQKLVKKLGEP